jgi:uncharacterized protein
MKLKHLLFILTLTSNIILEPGIASAQILNHEIFIKEIKNSSNNIYNDCLEKYDEYLKNHPGDVSVYIEKCKFIQFAQYDEDEDYNPNQVAFDSCSAALVKRFPENPDVFIFQTTYLYDDELEKVFEEAEKSISSNPGIWSKHNIGKLYMAMASHYYYQTEYKKAHSSILKAISGDPRYLSSFEYARILAKIKRPEDALKALSDEKDTIRATWELSQRADLFLELKAYSKALEIYHQIDLIDSTYNDKSALASTFDGLGKYDIARTYLVADTSQSWDKEGSARALFLHDLKHLDGKICSETYNRYRDFGFSADPLGFYRLKLFLSHPFQPWRFRDLLGLFCLIAALLVLLVIPSVWILPVYFVGHHWKLLSRPRPFESSWGLSAFWFVSFGFLVASFISAVEDPGYLYSLLSSSSYDLSVESRGHICLLFVIITALFGIAALYKVKPRILLSTNWSIAKSIWLAIGILLLYRIVVGIYVYIGASGFGVSVKDLTDIPGLLLSSRQDIAALNATYGSIVTVILVGLLAPFYEEIIFRGAVLESCTRYINFRAANILQALLFAAVHQSLFLFPAFFLFGIVSGKLRKESGGLLSGIVFHAANNLLTLSVLLLRSSTI